LIDNQDGRTGAVQTAVGVRPAAVIDRVTGVPTVVVCAGGAVSASRGWTVQVKGAEPVSDIPSVTRTTTG
jgi:hypothetical protein